MFLISIDVGIKNLALCVCDMDVSNNKIVCWKDINLTDDLDIKCSYSCNSNACFFKNNVYYCKKHSKQSNYMVPKISIPKLTKSKKPTIVACYLEVVGDNNINKTKDKLLEEILATYQEKYLNFIEKTNASNLDLITIGINLNKKLQEFLLANNLNSDTVGCVIIENQISPIANRMKSLQSMITQYFIDNSITNIKYISAANKLSMFDVSTQDYSDRKKASDTIVKNLLNDSINSSWLPFYNTNKKKDDLADSYLQALWFKKNNNN